MVTSNRATVTVVITVRPWPFKLWVNACRVANDDRRLASLPSDNMWSSIARSMWCYGSSPTLSVCLSVCFPHDISKTDAARITNLDLEMFHDKSWKLIYFGVKRSWSWVIKNTVTVFLLSCECWLLLVDRDIKALRSTRHKNRPFQKHSSQSIS